IRVAVLDTGIGASHPFLQKKWKREGLVDQGYRNFVTGPEQSQEPRDDHGHGTHCAGQILNFAPKAQLYVARVAASGIYCRTNKDFVKNIAEALEYATKTWNVNIISMSLGLDQPDVRVTEAIREAHYKNIAIFAAASNSGTRRSIAYPASRRSEVFCIHACNGLGKPSSFNPNVEKDILNFCILGESVHSIWLNDDESADTFTHKELLGRWKYMSGTSMSTPLAVALAANILAFARMHLSSFPDIETPELLRHVLQAMSKDAEGYLSITPWEGRHRHFAGYRDYGKFLAAFTGVVR
ncbi:subtilisin-like protein, partial [Byssothecium circinans]